MDLTIGAWLLSLVAISLVITRLGQERPFSPLSTVIGVLMTAGTTALYVFASKAAIKPQLAFAVVLLGFLAGLGQGRSAKLFFHGPILVAKQSRTYLIVWGIA